MSTLNPTSRPYQVSQTFNTSNPINPYISTMTSRPEPWVRPYSLGFPGQTNHSSQPYTLPMLGWYPCSDPLAQMNNIMPIPNHIHYASLSTSDLNHPYTQTFTNTSHPYTQPFTPLTLPPHTTYNPYSYNPFHSNPFPWPQSMEGGYLRPHHSLFLPFSLPKMDFPRFDGKDPRGWFKKCEKFFQLNPMLDVRSKVLYVALYLEGDADIWYQSLQDEHP